MRDASKASALFLVDFYRTVNRRHRNSASLRKLYGIGQDVEASKMTELSQAVLDDLEKQLSQKEIPQSERECPECRKKMSLIYIGDIEIDYCMCCDGVWFDPGELKEFTGEAKDVPSDNLKSRQSKYTCPECHRRMNEVVFQRPYNLLVDACPHGHGVYLEKGELERALDVTNPLRGKGQPG